MTKKAVLRALPFCAALVVTGGLWASAQTTSTQPTATPAPMATRFQQMDTNKDGKVAASEFKGPQERFKKLDANSDGFISQDELAAAIKKKAPGARGAAMFDRLDTNKDGKITADEFRGREARFKKLDANGDGAITKDELKSATAQKPAPAKPAPTQPAK